MPVSHQSAAILNSEEFTLGSDIVGDQFKISLGLPKDYSDTSKKYPVVFVLDANLFFGMVTDIARLLQTGDEMPACIVVGIGYPDHTQHLGLRIRDLTPVCDDDSQRDWLDKVSQAKKIPVEFKGSGGAERFLAFLSKEMMPFLRLNYRVALDDAVLVGDSYGGLFALYALFHQPALFKRYIIGSPSIYYGGAVTFEYETEYAAAHDDLKAEVFLSVGVLEAVYEPAFAGMVSNVARFAEVLHSRNYPGLYLITQIFENETHFSVIPATMSRGLRAVFGQRKWK
jgi:predicted alpha/beta superfamily hydrolase